MKRFCSIKVFFCLTAFFCCKVALSQGGGCPPNIDFEDGSFQNWQCYIGNVTSSGVTNIVNVSPSPPTLNRHTIISSSSNGVLDPYGNFPVRCPNGSAYSVKLGNNQTGSQAERISYTFTIPAGQNQFSIIYYYAVVFQDPQHQIQQQPRFTTKVYDVDANEYVSCATFEYVATSNIPGFTRSLFDPNIWYKSWSPVTINLSGYAGKTIRLEFTTADCTLGGHFGYAYLDVNTNCTGVVTGAYYCPNSDSVTLTAPFGYQEYYWYNSDLSQLLGTQPTLTITPAPPVNSVFALDLVPYPGFGCHDTIYTTIQIAPLPPANAGADKSMCSGRQVGIGLPAVAGYTYNWSPATGLSDPNIANPIASPSVTGDYVLTVTDALTGCTAKDTVTVSILPSPTASFTITSRPGQCLNQNNFSFTHSNPSGFSYLWEFGDGATSTNTSPVHNYSAPGTYTIKLIASGSGGCMDSSSQDIIVYPMPAGSLTSASNYICEGIPTVLTATGGATYHWYKDGVIILPDSLAVFNALQPGTYTVEVVNAQGCKNFANNSVPLSIVKKPTPGFVYDKYCTGIPINFLNKSIVNNSLPVDYLWDFGNGHTSTQYDPVFVFDSSGNIPVKLSVTPQACPQLVTTFQKIIPIEATRRGINYFPVNAVENKPLQLKARNFGAQYLWVPSTYLSNPVSATPVFISTQEWIYQIRITTVSGCITVDTQLVRIFKTADIYLPQAFTPNGDGRNDKLYPFLVGIKQLKYFRILNRWGIVVYESITDLPGWDGTVRGKPQPMDGYVWEAEGIDIGGNIVRRKGTVTLIR
jgi:gliding motility-associated-like protein